MKKKDELRPEYGEELFGAMKANRFAGRDLTFKGRRAIYLDDDVAEVFDSAEAVNTVLRSVIRAMRSTMPPSSAKASHAAVRTKRGAS
jgi:hypothetical protein